MGAQSTKRRVKDSRGERMRRGGGFLAAFAIFALFSAIVAPLAHGATCVYSNWLNTNENQIRESGLMPSFPLNLEGDQ